MKNESFFTHKGVYILCKYRQNFFPVVFALTFFFKLLSGSNNYINRVQAPIR